MKNILCRLPWVSSIIIYVLVILGARNSDNEKTVEADPTILRASINFTNLRNSINSNIKISHQLKEKLLETTRTAQDVLIRHMLRGDRQRATKWANLIETKAKRLKETNKNTSDITSNRKAEDASAYDNFAMQLLKLLEEAQSDLENS